MFHLTQQTLQMTFANGSTISIKIASPVEAFAEVFAEDADGTKFVSPRTGETVNLYTPNELASLITTIRFKGVVRVMAEGP